MNSSIKDEIQETLQHYEYFLKEFQSICDDNTEDCLKKLKSLYHRNPIESFLLTSIVLSAETLPRPAATNDKYIKYLEQARSLLKWRLTSIDKLLN